MAKESNNLSFYWEQFAK